MSTQFTIDEEDLLASSMAGTSVSSPDDDPASRIPILRRRAAAAAAASSSAADGGGGDGPAPGSKDPVCVIVVGMAGSGKTTLMAQLQRSLRLRARASSAASGDDDGSGAAEGDSSSPDAEDGAAASSRTGYAINLDPAARYVPFESSIDIRDTVDYVEVMRQHKLGPNGAILTCLNLFATKSRPGSPAESFGKR